MSPKVEDFIKWCTYYESEVNTIFGQANNPFEIAYRMGQVHTIFRDKLWDAQTELNQITEQDNKL